MTKELIEGDRRHASEIEAEANAAFEAAIKHKKDHPTGDDDEDSFLRTFRSLIAGKSGNFSGDVYQIGTSAGEVILKFVDPLAKRKSISEITINGDVFDLSMPARAYLWEIVTEEAPKAAHHERDVARRDRLNAFVEGVSK